MRERSTWVRACLTWATFGLMACGVCPAKGRLQSDPEVLEDLLRMTQRTIISRAKEEQVLERYARELRIGRLGRAIDCATHRECESRFEAAFAVGYFTLDALPIQEAAVAYSRLEKLGVATGRQTDLLFTLYASARMFGSASELHPDLVPSVEYAPGLHPDEAALWTYDARDRKLVEERFVAGGPQVVVVAHPRCHFSTRAAEAIARDTTLSAVMSLHSIWVAPQRGDLDLDELEHWNSSHPQEIIRLVDQERAWPFVDGWDTPTFYFLRDGKAVFQFAGWPPEGHLAELRQGLENLGLLSPDAAATPPGHPASQ